MGKQWFERILSLLVNRQRAAEITGDLMEQHSSDVRFWWAAFQVLISFTWRPVLGVLSGEAFLILSSLCFGRFWNEAGNPLLINHWQTVSMWANYSGSFAWPVACMALARFGFRSSISSASCVFAALSTLLVCSFTSPPLQLAGLVAAALIISCMLVSAENRRSLALIARSAFSIWLVETVGTRVYFELLRHLRIPLRPAEFAGLALTFATWSLASLAGWLALRPQVRSGMSGQQSNAALIGV